MNERQAVPERTFEVEEHPEIPVLSLILGYGPMSLVLAGGVLAWIGPHDARAMIAHVTTIFAASLLAFLAGVRRGLSFRTEGGPRAAQVVTMFILFSVALVALLVMALSPRITQVLLLVGFAILAVEDPRAAGRGEAPLFFARLRRPQLALAILGIVALLASVPPSS